MRTTCIINNFNYGAYIGEAIESILNQTVAFDEVIVVDDGSTDNSVSMIEKAIEPHQNVKVIAKHNEGQLSCFNAGFSASTGDLIFFWIPMMRIKKTILRTYWIYTKAIQKATLPGVR